jgi:3-oxoacyl-[acyl-carrier-protein] synthase II
VVTHDVAVTGMAWTTALGAGLDEVWARLLDGATGLSEMESSFELRNRLAAQVPDPPAEWSPTRRQVALTAATLRRAVAHAGAPADALPVIGTSYGPHLDEPGDDLRRWAAEATAAAGLTRPPLSVTSACSSGSDAIAVAARLIREGAAEVCVCGGVDVLTPAKRLAHTALGTMSPTLLRSFDRRHNGTLLGEGAGFCVLERLDRAKSRGAAVHAVMRGSGSSNDAATMTSPDLSGDGVLLAVRRALSDAGATADDVAVVNAHGSATPVNDHVETVVLSRMFTGRRPIAFATKGAFGHTLGATGALEAIAVILALREGKVPPVYGLSEPAEDFPLPLPVGAPSEIGEGLGISVTLAFGGFNTCLVFGRAEAGDVG